MNPKAIMPEEPTGEMLRVLFTLNSATPRSTAEVRQAYTFLRNVVMQDTPPQPNLRGWLPIDQADKGIAYIHALGPIQVGNSYPIWARDADGRVFECLWADDGKRAYWWDSEAESPVDPVEFMPHPLDTRFAATTEGSDNG